MKVVFMGTPDFAVPTLKKLNKYHDVIGVFTQTDKPVGRKQIMTPPDVKVEAEKLGLQVFQPKSLKNNESFELIKELSPDVIVVAAYGKILPKNILDFPKFGCINVHASLLPKYRGAAPIQWSVINGDDKAGVTIMKMAEGIDTGDIISQKEITININDTALYMFDTLSEIGADLLIETLKDIENGTATFTKQDDSLSSYASMLDKSISEIDFNKSAFNVHKLICGLYSWPIAQTSLNGKRLKIYKSEVSVEKGDPGEVICVDPLIIGCGENSIKIIELQLEGSKRMDAQSFVNGRKICKGDKLGK